MNLEKFEEAKKLENVIYKFKCEIESLKGAIKMCEDSRDQRLKFFGFILGNFEVIDKYLHEYLEITGKKWAYDLLEQLEMTLFKLKEEFNALINKR